jgi:hypothetical protein
MGCGGVAAQHVLHTTEQCLIQEQQHQAMLCGIHMLSPLDVLLQIMLLLLQKQLKAEGTCSTVCLLTVHLVSCCCCHMPVLQEGPAVG